MHHRPTANTRLIVHKRNFIKSHNVCRQSSLFKTLVPDNSLSQHTCNICFYKDLMFHPYRIWISLFLREVKSREIENRVKCRKQKHVCFTSNRTLLMDLMQTDLNYTRQSYKAKVIEFLQRRQKFCNVFP